MCQDQASDPVPFPGKREEGEGARDLHIKAFGLAHSEFLGTILWWIIF